MELVKYYLEKTPLQNIDTGFLAYLSNIQKIAEVSPQIAKAIVQELKDQRSNLKLIASENFSSLSVQSAMGNLLTDKYAEGFPHHRFYAGCDNVDVIEDIACTEAKKLFGCDHAYVQPHSGADANLIAFWAILRTRVQLPFLEKTGEPNLLNLGKDDWDRFRQISGNQKLLALDLYSGGHLTHGYRFNVSAQMFDTSFYGVDKASGLLDLNEVESLVQRIRPLILLVGYSAYTRKIDFARLREIADKVHAVLMVDMAHFAGLVAGKVFTGKYNPVPYADVVTSTTHKTLRGPRGGLILCREEFAESVDKGCPMVMGGPLPHVMAAKALCLIEAQRDEFREYAARIVENSNALARAFRTSGIEVITGGTDNHIVLLDVRPFGLTGRQAESALRECAITLNRNTIPDETNGPWYTSGLRVGTPSVTTLGMGPGEMEEIARFFRDVLEHTKPSAVKTEGGSTQPSKAKYILDENAKKRVRTGVHELLQSFQLYKELDMEVLEKFLS